jgi:hypothetical protein
MTDTQTQTDTQSDIQPLGRYIGQINTGMTGQPFVDGNEVWAHVGWVCPDTHDVYGLHVPPEHRDRINQLCALYISLGTRYGQFDEAGYEGAA